MRIWLIDHYTNTPLDVGDARHFSNARELIRRGHQARVVACSFNHLTHVHCPMSAGSVWDNQIHDGVPFTIIKARPYGSNFEMARILNMLEFTVRAWRAGWAKGLDAPDLILGSAPDPFVALAAERLAARYRVPFVLEIRDPWPFAISEVTGRSKDHPFVRLVDVTMRYLYRKAQRIVMLSRDSADLLAEGGAEEKKIVWIPHGVDLEMTPAPRPRQQDGSFIVTYIGAHNKWNSLDVVLDAARMIEREAPSVLLRFVGDGEAKPGLVERAKAEGIGNVRFEDAVPKKQVAEVLDQSDAFIINNRKDGVSKRWMSFNKLYEYLAAGRPVVFGSYTGDDPVRESGAGLSVEPDNPAALAEAIALLARMPREELIEMGARGRRFIERHYSIPVLMDRFEAMAGELTGSGEVAELAS